jgi:L-fuculose-phosphate aldolase
MGNRKTYIKKEIAKYSQRLDAKGFGANHDGNISALFDDAILATPTAVSKGNVNDDMIITLDREGKKIEGIGNPFSEIKLHLAAYRARPDAKAVVHAHPPFATARGLVGKSLTPSLPEAIVSIGDQIPVIEFSMPGTPESETLVEQAFSLFDVVMLAGNGVMAIGDDVEQAYLRVELAEHLCKINFCAESTGTAMTLSKDQIQSLLEKRKKAGLGPEARLEKIIAEEIQKILA